MEAIKTAETADDKLLRLMSEIVQALSIENPGRAIGLFVEASPHDGGQGFLSCTKTNMAGAANMAAELIENALAHRPGDCPVCAAAARGLRAALKSLSRERRTAPSTCH